MDGISRSKNMKKKTVELLSHYFDDNDFRFTKSQNHEVDIDDLLTVKRSEDGDRKLSKKIKRLMKELQNCEVITHGIIEEYFRSIQEMRDRNYLNESSEIIKLHDYVKEQYCELDLWCNSK